MPNLLFLLLFFLLLAAVCSYFGWKQGATDTGSKHRARAGFYLSLGFALLICVSLWQRSGADNRLQDAGITPHPALWSPSGLAAGQPADRQVWVYKTRLPGRDMLDFYRDSAHLSGWQTEEDGNGLLAFRQDGRKLVISGGNDHKLVFTISPAH